MRKIVDCFEFCLSNLTRKMDFTEFEPPQGSIAQVALGCTPEGDDPADSVNFGKLDLAVHEVA